MVWFDRNPGGKKIPEAEPEKAPEAVMAAPEPAPPAAAKPEPEAPIAAAGAKVVGHLYKGSRVTGQLVFDGAAQIDGIVDGEIRCNGTLTIGEGAEIRAKISGQAIIVRGRIEGNLTAKEKVELVAPARVYGNIATPRLIITEGVVFDGDCSMGVAKQKAAVAAFQSASAEKATAAPAPKLKADSE